MVDTPPEEPRRPPPDVLAYGRELAPWRSALDRRVSGAIEPIAHWLVRHWLATLNVAVALFVTLPVLAPILMAAGWTTPASWIYQLYQFFCHQWAFRSFFLFGPQAVYSFEQLNTLAGENGAYAFIGSPALGYKMAFCERDVAIYGAMVLAGVGFSYVRHRLPPPSLLVLAVLLAPITLDGGTQLFGLRESNWWLRVLTGAQFGVSAVWLIYPQLERSALRAARAYRLA